MEQEHGQAYRQGRIHELDRQDDLPLANSVENFFGESIMLHQQNLLGRCIAQPSGYREIPVCGQLCGRGIHRCAFSYLASLPEENQSFSGSP